MGSAASTNVSSKIATASFEDLKVAAAKLPAADRKKLVEALVSPDDRYTATPPTIESAAAKRAELSAVAARPEATQQDVSEDNDGSEDDDADNDDDIDDDDDDDDDGEDADEDAVDGESEEDGESEDEEDGEDNPKYKYEGELNAAGQREGRGTMRLADGVEYTGEWRAGRGEGRGTFRYGSGNEYTGEFKAGNEDGRGTCRYASGDVYTGEWKAGKKNGRGTMRRADGSVYVVRFEAGGAPIGEGAMWSADGQTAWRLRDGQPVETIYLEEARAIAARVGEPLPDHFEAHGAIPHLKALDAKLSAVLLTGAIALLSADWLRAGGLERMLRRQDLEARAKDTSEAIFLAPADAAALIETGGRLVGSLTYGWSTPDHPDPSVRLEPARGRRRCLRSTQAPRGPPCALTPGSSLAASKGRRPREAGRVPAQRARRARAGRLRRLHEPPPEALRAARSGALGRGGRELQGGPRRDGRHVRLPRRHDRDAPRGHPAAAGRARRRARAAGRRPEGLPPGRQMRPKRRVSDRRHSLRAAR